MEWTWKDSAYNSTSGRLGDVFMGYTAWGLSKGEKYTGTIVTGVGRKAQSNFESHKEAQEWVEMKAKQYLAGISAKAREKVKHEKG